MSLSVDDLQQEMVDRLRAQELDAVARCGRCGAWVDPGSVVAGEHVTRKVPREEPETCGPVFVMRRTELPADPQECDCRTKVRCRGCARSSYRHSHVVISKPALVEGLEPMTEERQFCTACTETLRFLPVTAVEHGIIAEGEVVASW